MKMIMGLVKDFVGFCGTIKELLVQRYCYQLIVPEYKARHLASSLYQLQEWVDCYPVETQKIMMFPKKLGF